MSSGKSLPMARHPHPNAPGLEAGVTEPMIHDLVHAFYARVRGDDLLGPVFAAVVADWDAHLNKMCAFWSSVTLLTGSYKGTPMQAHAACRRSRLRISSNGWHCSAKRLRRFARRMPQRCFSTEPSGLPSPCK